MNIKKINGILESNKRLEENFIIKKSTLSEYFEQKFSFLLEKNHNTINVGNIKLPGFWDSCLISESFDYEERVVLGELFNSIGMVNLNEADLSKVYDYFKKKINNATDWLENLGSKGVDLLKKGLKTISDFFNKLKTALTELWGMVKKFFSYIYEKSIESFNKIKSKISEATIKWRSEETENISGIITDVKQLYECSSHVKNKFTNYFTNILDNAVTKSSTELLNKVGNEAGNSFDELKECFKKNDIISIGLSVNDNKKILSESNLSEIDWGWKEFLVVIAKGVSWIFNPIGKAIEEIVKFITKNIFKAVSYLSKTFSGPGVFDFEILSGLSVGLTAMIMDLGHFGLPNWVHGIVECIVALIPGISDIKTLMEIMHKTVIGALAAEIIYELLHKDHGGHKVVTK